MENNLRVFNNVEFGNVRTLMVGNEPWFVGKDIASVLGYSNASKAVSVHVDEDDRIKEMIAHSQNGNMVKTQTTLINESGLYSLILSSKLPQAKKFKRWVTSEVLPQIRQTGGYIPVKDEESDEDILARALIVAQRTIERKNELLKKTQKELDEKDKIVRKIEGSENLLLVREVAKIAKKDNIEIGEKRLWSKLREWGLISKKSTEPMQTAMEQGLFQVIEGTRENVSGTFVYTTTKVTGKGQIYIINKLLKEVG